MAGEAIALRLEAIAPGSLSPSRSPALDVEMDKLQAGSRQGAPGLVLISVRKSKLSSALGQDGHHMASSAQSRRP